MRTSSVFTPYSCAARPAFSAATCAAKGVDLREPRKPAPPAVAHDNALPWRSVMVMMVLLKEACTCTMPSVTMRLAFFFGLTGLAMFKSSSESAAMDGRYWCFRFRGDCDSYCRLSKGRSWTIALLLDRPARTLARARIGARALAAHRQAAAVTQAAIGAEVDQPLDADADFAAQVALDRETRDFLAQLFHLAFGQRLDRRGRIDPGLHADRLRPRAADAVDALQAHPNVLVDRQVDTRDARHIPSLRTRYVASAANC